MVRRDCYWYHCEHDMGASIDCCTAEKRLGECPCSDDCTNYISQNEVASALRHRIPTKVTHEATIYKCCTCPSCGNVVDSFEHFNGKRVRIMTLYCVYCGQALDWSDEEKQTVTL